MAMGILRLIRRFEQGLDLLDPGHHPLHAVADVTGGDDVRREPLYGSGARILRSSRAHFFIP